MAGLLLELELEAVGVLPAPVVAVVCLAPLVADAPLEEVVDEALDPARGLADLAVDAAHKLVPRAISSRGGAAAGAVAVARRLDRVGGVNGRLRRRSRHEQEQKQKRRVDRSGHSYVGPSDDGRCCLLGAREVEMEGQG